MHGVSICRSASKITNLLFADDSLIFGRPTPAEINTIVEILQVYAKAFGQCINLEKSSVYFSNNTTVSQKQEALGILGVKEMARFESYLGLPTLIGRAKYHTFSFIKDRVWKKTTGVEGDDAIQRWERSSHQGSCSVYSNVYNECFSAPIEIM